MANFDKIMGFVQGANSSLRTKLISYRDRLAAMNPRQDCSSLFQGVEWVYSPDENKIHLTSEDADRTVSCGPFSGADITLLISAHDSLRDCGLKTEDGVTSYSKREGTKFHSHTEILLSMSVSTSHPLFEKALESRDRAPSRTGRSPVQPGGR